MKFQDDNVFGYVAPDNFADPNALNDEYVQLIITEITHPTPYLKQLKELQETTGLPQIPSFKRGGVALKCSVLYRSRDMTKAPDELVWLQDPETGSLKEPSYPIHMELIMDPLPLIFQKDYDFNTNLPDSTLKAGNIQLVDYLPRASKTRSWKLKKNIDEMTADDEDYAILLDRERKRVEAWTKLLTAWQDFPEEVCKEKLLVLLSRKYLICKREGDRLMFAIPEIGCTFQVANKAGKYPMPNAYGFIKDEKGKSAVVHYSSLDVHPPTDGSLKYVELIKAAKAKAAQERIAAKKAATEPSERPF